MLLQVLSQYIPGAGSFHAEPIGSGLIHQTWKLTDGKQSYILQQINHHIFKDPYAIAENIQQLNHYLQQHSPEYLFIAPLPTIEGKLIAEAEGNYYRLFPFVEGSYTVDTVQTPEQAFEAASAFGKFTRLLSGFNVSKLNITIPCFHNISLRYQQFQQAIEQGNAERIKQAKPIINKLQSYVAIADQYNQIKVNPAIQLHVTHHDTKISNVLFNEQQKAICVIDLDTVMPGYFISDVGDMMRTYLSPVNEEEADFSKIQVRKEVYDAVVQGYQSQVNDMLSAAEQQLFFYSGQFMIYMQALRFLTDYLNNDVYYGAKYELHNYNRSLNQLTLLERYNEGVGSR
jgi:Ser/Thr protein kinase RdoA (MazF antagonist)